MCYCFVMFLMQVTLYYMIFEMKTNVCLSRLNYETSGRRERKHNNLTQIQYNCSINHWQKSKIQIIKGSCNNCPAWILRFIIMPQSDTNTIISKLQILSKLLAHCCQQRTIWYASDLRTAVIAEDDDTS